MELELLLIAVGFDEHIYLKSVILYVMLSTEFELFCLTSHNFGLNQYFLMKFGSSMHNYLLNKSANFYVKIFSINKVIAIFQRGPFLAHPVYTCIFSYNL